MSILRSVTRQRDVPYEGTDAGAALSLRSIRAAVRGAAGELSRATAVELLAASDYPAKHRDLQQLLEDETAPEKLRYLAALGLPRGDIRAAHQILVAATRYREDRVRGVMRALGQIGGKEALDTIERVLPETAGSARTQGVFAATLIAHRLGLPGHEVPVPSANQVLDMAPDHGVRVHIRRALSSEAERSVVSLGQRPYGIELADEPMYEYRCDRCAGTIMLNREFTGRSALDTLTQRKAIFGIGTVRDAASGTYSPAALFLTTPDARSSGIRISVHLTNGSQLFVGDAIVSDGEAQWNLRAVRRLGAFPIRAEGDFKQGHLNIRLAASGTRIVQRAHPTAVDLSPARNKAQQTRG